MESASYVQGIRTILNLNGCNALNVASFLQDVPEDKHLETLNSYLLEATARIENPIRDCTTLLTSLEQKVEELQVRVTALEARLEKGSSCVNPLCSFALPGGSSRFPSSAEDNVPAVIPTAMNLPEPAPGSFLRLLLSAEDIAPEIPPPTVNLIENGAFLTEVNLPSFSNPFYDQATLDAVHIVSRVKVIEQVRVHLRVFSDAHTELVVILDSRGIGIIGTSLIGGEIKLVETYSDLSGISLP
ncbi:hypothetical protein LguiB_014276 [Lonicera macranthoides]